MRRKGKRTKGGALSPSKGIEQAQPYFDPGPLRSTGAGRLSTGLQA